VPNLAGRNYNWDCPSSADEDNKVLLAPICNRFEHWREEDGTVLVFRAVVVREVWVVVTALVM